MDKEIYDNSKRCFEGSCTMRAYMSHMKGMMGNGKIILPFVLSFLLAIGALAKGGGLLWDDQFDKGVGVNAARAITAQGNRVYAAGRGETAGGDDEFVVRAYDAKTGDLLWDDQFDNGGGRNIANAITAQGNMVYAAGRGRTAGGNVDEFVVRAYDAR